MAWSLTERSGPRRTEGAVFIEYLAAFTPILMLGMGAWQQIEIGMGELVVQRAAMAAARAAAVVLPDDPVYYANIAVNDYSGLRQTDVELAAAVVLSASDSFREVPTVQVERTSQVGMVSATVTARFECLLGWVNLTCTSHRILKKTAQFPYQGARYKYSRL